MRIERKEQDEGGGGEKALVPYEGQKKAVCLKVTQSFCLLEYPGGVAGRLASWREMRLDMTHLSLYRVTPTTVLV